MPDPIRACYYRAQMRASAIIAAQRQSVGDTRGARMWAALADFEAESAMFWSEADAPQESPRFYMLEASA